MEDRIRLEELYGRNVFTLSKMKERLPKSVYRKAGSFPEPTRTLSPRR